MAAQELKTEQEIVNKFQQLLEERNALSTAAIERRSEVAEHELVVKTLEPLDASRKCFKLLGDILVERTVGEVLPTVNENKNNLLSVSWVACSVDAGVKRLLKHGRPASFHHSPNARSW